MFQVLIFSDESILLAGLRHYAADVNDLRFAYSSDVRTLAEQVRSTAADLLLLDVAGDLDYGLLRSIQHVAPECRIVLWSRDISTEVASQVVQLGVRGILRRTASASLLMDCIRRVIEGEVWLERSLSTALLTLKSIRLTRRESQMVLLLSQGMKNKEIANELGISEQTVKVYISRLFEKVGARSRMDLALYGLRNSPQLLETAGPGLNVAALQSLTPRVAARL